MPRQAGQLGDGAFAVAGFAQKGAALGAVGHRHLIRGDDDGVGASLGDLGRLGGRQSPHQRFGGFAGMGRFINVGAERLEGQP